MANLQQQAASNVLAGTQTPTLPGVQPQWFQDQGGAWTEQQLQLPEEGTYIGERLRRGLADPRRYGFSEAQMGRGMYPGGPNDPALQAASAPAPAPAQPAPLSAGQQSLANLLTPGPGSAPGMTGK